MNYDYYKSKYKKITIQLSRETDADIIAFLEQFPGNKKFVICECLRFLMRHMHNKGVVNDGNKNI